MERNGEKPAALLRVILAERSIQVVPSIVDALQARSAELAGAAAPLPIGPDELYYALEKRYAAE